MKILWLSHLVPYPPKAGVLLRSYNLVKELAKYHDVYLLAFNQPNLMKPMFPSLEEGIQEAELELGKFCKDIKFLDIPCEQRRFGRHALALKSLLLPTSYTVNWLKSVEYKQSILDWQSKYSFDIVHADTISLVPYAHLCGNAKTSLDHHNIESHMMLRRASTETNLVKKLYFYQEGKKLQAYEEKYCPKFDINITCSVLDTERLQEFIPNIKAVDIPNGVDVDYFMPLKQEKKAKSMVFAGGLTWYPNNQAMQYFVNDIWPLLKQKEPTAIMNLIGKGPASNLVELSKEDKNFNVLGFVDDVRKYIDTATLYICPILDGGGTKLKILDALSMGSALVASPEACEGIDVTHKENVLIANSPEEYVQHIITLFNDPKLCENLSENGRQLMVNKYSYKNIGIKLSNTLQNLIKL